MSPLYHKSRSFLTFVVSRSFAPLTKSSTIANVRLPHIASPSTSPRKSEPPLVVEVDKIDQRSLPGSIADSKTPSKSSTYFVLVKARVFPPRRRRRARTGSKVIPPRIGYRLSRVLTVLHCRDHISAIVFALVWVGLLCRGKLEPDFVEYRHV